MSRVICAGHVNWDITLRVDRLPGADGEATVKSKTGAGGGSAANVASTLAGLDVSSVLLGSVGDDDVGDSVRGELAAAGVDCAHVTVASGHDTAVKYLVVDDDGEVFVLGCSGANEAFDAESLPEAALATADHLHLTGQRPETAAALADRATEAGVPVSFDPGRLVADRGFRATLAAADVVFLNDREAAAAVDADLPSDAQTLVVKRGPDGSELRTPTETVTHSGFSVDAVDTTGAGDAFAAGFIAARLDGASPERALAVADACGALAASELGARAAVTWDAVRRLTTDGPG